MRRILKFLYCFVLLFLFIPMVFSEEETAKIVCEYPDLIDGETLTMTWDLEDNFNTSTNPHVEFGDYSSDVGYERVLLLWRSGKQVNLSENANIDQKLYEAVLGNYGCNDGMKVCIYTEAAIDNPLGLSSDLLAALFAWDWDKVDLGGRKQELIIMTDKEYRDSNYALWEVGGIYVLAHDQVVERWSNGYNFGDIIGSLDDWIKGLMGSGDDHHTYVFKETDCVTAHYDGPYIGVNINCSLLKNKILGFISKMSAYKACGEDNYCKSQAIFKVREAEDGIKSQCRSILEGYNYTGGEAECVDDCLNIKDSLDQYKAGTDLAEEYNSGQCGFSARLLVWVNNILRWVKYILPVLVIILSILNFIKAIGADKDDEMKKAQKKFIIRLIAAALVFLIPLIIEFILNKMGFGYDSCGLF